MITAKNFEKRGFVISELHGFLEYEIGDNVLLWNDESKKLIWAYRDLRESGGYSELKVWENLNSLEQLRKIIEVLSWD